MTTKITMDQAVIVLESIIAANETNRENGNKDNIAISLISEHGLGKSTMIEEFAKERDLGFHSINLASITDETSLFGYPRETYKMISPNEDVEDVRVENLNQYIDKGYRLVNGESELTYSTPKFVNELYNYPNGSILLFDESTRAMNHIQQGCMELFRTGKYANWELPENCLIVICNNPDDEGNYNITTGMDDAQKDRFFNYHLKRDTASWVSWASKNGINEVCINFYISNPEIVEKESPRLWTRFFRSIVNIDLKKDKDSLYLTGLGSIGRENLLAFKSYIENNLDILPSFKELFNESKSVDSATEELSKACFDRTTGEYRTDISGLLTMRLKSYLRACDYNKTIPLKIISFIKKGILTEELTLILAKDIFSNKGRAHPHKKNLTSVIREQNVRDLLLNNGLNLLNE